MVARVHSVNMKHNHVNFRDNETSELETMIKTTRTHAL